MKDYGNVYGFSGEAKNNVSIGSFVKGGAKATIMPLRAYLVYNGENSSQKTAGIGSGVSSFDMPEELEVVVLDEQGKTTERWNMNTRTGEIRSSGWFDLQGRKLNAKPTVQGTYYSNGKRVIVK